MYAVFNSGGRQYRVKAGDKLTIEKIATGIGEGVSFDKVLLVRDSDKVHIGAPFVDGATVQATVVDQARARKLLIFKFKRRQGYKRLNGHRQHLTHIRIDAINMS
jgi:large subunit ribosomal protein L21